MKKIILLLLFSTPLFAQSFGNAKVSEITSIYDGDTFRANIEGWPELIGKRIPIRINGIDTPELRGKCEKEKILARKAKQETVSILRTGKNIVLLNLQRGKYFRIVSDVEVDGLDLGNHLIKQGLAVPYNGGKKIKDWCSY